jgi:hypothetical protein
VRLSTRLLTYNWRLKLAALGLAMLVWAVVSAEQVTTQWIPVRVDPVIGDPEYVMTGSAEPAEVRVQFSGAGRELWQLALDRPVLVLSLRDIGDRRAFPLDPSMVRLPQGVSVRAQDVRPAVVRLDLQRLASRVIPVRARISGRSLQRYVVGEDLEILPAEVRVTGPADQLAALDALTTRSFEIVPVTDSTFSSAVHLDTAGMEGLSFSRTEVRVSGGLDVRAERTLAEVQVYVPDGLVATPDRVQVTVSGPRRLLNGLFATGVRAVVPRDSLPAAVAPGGVEAPMVFDGLPRGIGARAMPMRVRVAPAAASAPVPADSQAEPEEPAP